MRGPEFLARLREEVLIGDGALGTLLSERVGRQTAYERLNRLNPGLVRSLHAAYLDAGSQVLESNTFGANRTKLGTRVVELHPVTLAQNARTSGGGNVTMVPKMAITVGPKETWMADKVSIWHAGAHDNPLGQRLTAFMISKGIADSAVPMSLLADHPNVQFNYFRGGIGSVAVEMH